MKKLGTRHENLDFKVYRELKSMIVDRKLKPGDKILQEKIAREFGVSRTPLMCALKKLEQEMYRHARNLEFEQAAKLRDEIQKIRQFGLGMLEARVG